MNEKQKRRYLLETENVKTALLRLGISTMIGMLVSALYNIVDTFLSANWAPHKQPQYPSSILSQ